jgi:hypothetical protein
MQWLGEAEKKKNKKKKNKKNTTRKLINTNGNTDENIPSVNCNEFYRKKYSPDIYHGNYNGKNSN